MEERIKCPYCGNEVYKNIFCSECGHVFGDDDVYLTEPIEKTNDSFIDLETLPEPIELDEELKEINTVNPEDEGFNLIVDSYNATVATVGGDYYEEYCLYQKDDIYEIHHFVKHYNRPEFHEAFKTNEECKKELYELIENKKLIDYVNSSYPAMTGGVLVIKFKKDDKMIRISSDNLPYQNHDVFYELRSILLKYVNKDNKKA